MSALSEGGIGGGDGCGGGCRWGKDKSFLVGLTRILT
jgi:hypothetical protein